MQAPVTFEFQSWHEATAHTRSIVIGATLELMAKHNHGVVPAELETEPQLQAFANASTILIVDADVEPAIIFPHRTWASRDFVKETYRQFIDFCHHAGYDVTPNVPPTEIGEPHGQNQDHSTSDAKKGKKAKGTKEPVSA